MAYSDVMQAAQGYQQAGNLPGNMGKLYQKAIRAKYGDQLDQALQFVDPNALLGQEADQYNTARDYGNRATGDYLSAAENFDASKALNKYATGAWDQVSGDLDKTLARLKGEAVGAGRADSGFFDEDQGDVIQNVTRQFNDSLAQQALGAEQLQQANTAGLGSFGLNQTGMANDLLVARREEEANARRDEEEKKAKKKSGIGSLLGGAIGAFTPLGPAAGSAIGGAVGSYF